VNALAIGRNIALKVPAIANGLEMQIAISAVKDDNLGRTLQLLNGDDFKKPLELAPVAVGQILTITNLVKRVFTDMEPSQVLTASYPGIISEAEMSDPVANNRLVEGYIILIVKQDDEDRLDFDSAGLSVEGDTLLFNKNPIPNTYMVYNVTTDQFRGRDAESAWSKKFVQASSKADELIFAAPDQRQHIISAAYDLLKEGGALLDNDDNYLISERTRWKKAVYVEVADKIKDNSGAQPPTGAPSALARAARALGIAPEDKGREPTEENIRDEVREFSGELAKAGLALGFSSRLPAPAPPPRKKATGKK